jgi:hypothetical protein
VSAGVDEEVNSIIATVPDNRLAKMASEHQRLSTKLAETTRCIVSTRAATDLQARLAQFDADVASGRPPSTFSALLLLIFTEDHILNRRDDKVQAKLCLRRC